MCEQAHDCAKHIQDHWDDCKRKNALERNELRIGMGEIAPEGYGGPGEQMNVYYENPFEDPHYHEQLQDEYLQKFTMVRTEEERRLLHQGESF